MTHMSKMTRSHTGKTGMRKGLSLVEMLISIILFGIIATIGFTYYKNYYDTSFAAKQLRIYTIVDQAAQLSNTFDLYNAKYGENPTEIQQMVDTKFLTAIPQKQSFVTSTGWTLEENQTIVEANATGITFQYVLNGAGSGQDNLDYCNILNNAAWSDSNLSKTTDEQNASSTWYSRGISVSEGNTSETEFFHCEKNSTGSLNLIFVKTANAS